MPGRRGGGKEGGECLGLLYAWAGLPGNHADFGLRNVMGFMASYHPHITFIPTSFHWTYLQYCVQVLRRGGAGQGLPQQVGAHSALKLRTGGGKLRKAGGQGLPDRWALEF